MYSTGKSSRLPLLAGVLLALVVSSCARTPQQKEARFLESGKKCMADKDYARAALQFMNAVQATPRDPEAYYQLALAYLAQGKVAEAVYDLHKTTELNPAHAGAQVKLAEMMAMSGVPEAFQEGEKRMQEVLRSSPQDVDAIDALAINEFELGKADQAEQHLEEALERFPQSVKSAVALAKVNLAQNNLKAAEEALRKAAKASPQSPEAETGIGEIYLIASRWADAETEFRAALKIDPQFSLALIGLANAQVRQGHLDQAEQTYRTISTLRDKKYRGLHAEFLFEEGKREEAVKEFEELARQHPTERADRSQLVSAYVLTNHIAEANAVLAKALKANGKDTDALLQQSELLLRAGKADEAEKDLTQILHYQRDSAQSHYLLSVIHKDRGDVQRERQELNEALTLAPAFLAARLRLSQNLVMANSANSALNILDAAPAGQKQTLPFVIQRNWVLLALNNKEEARQWVSRAMAVRRTPDLLLQDAVLKSTGHDFAGARASAEEALKANPEDVRALRIVAATYVVQKQTAAATRELQAYAAQHPKSLPVQQFFGEWLLANGSPEQARAALSAALQMDPNSLATSMALARLDISEGKSDAARERLTQIAAAYPGKTEPQLWLGSIELKSGNQQAAAAHFRKVLEADPRNFSALNNLAYLLADSQIDEALGYAQQAQSLAPDSVDAAGTLGWILYRKGIYDMALKQLQDAVAKDGNSASTNAAIRKYHLAMAYLKLGDRQSGVKTLGAALKIDPNLPEARQASMALQ